MYKAITLVIAYAKCIITCCTGESVDLEAQSQLPFLSAP